MKYDKIMTAKMIQDKIDGNSFLNYMEIATITGYHPKYILKLKKEILDGTFASVHGNKKNKPANTISKDEEQKIVSLYQKTHVSIRKFCKFYQKRSYSCIYNVLKRNNLIHKK